MKSSNVESSLMAPEDVAIPLYNSEKSSSEVGLDFSPTFDSEYYLTRNPDVAEAGIDPRQHYLAAGLEEGRLPKNDFSINIEFTAGSEFFTPAMRAAINDAADVWENTISRSNFRDGHILTIEVGGANQGIDGFEAVADIERNSLVDDSNGNSLPVEGYSIVNTNPTRMRNFASNIDYFTDVMTHEFGHVMGIGTLWAENDLIDPFTGIYFEETNAGEVFKSYGNSGAIPLTFGERAGSDNAHWRESVFGNELMTSIVEVPGVSMPLSSLTIASLADIGWNVYDGAAEIYPDFGTELATVV